MQILYSNRHTVPGRLGNFRAKPSRPVCPSSRARQLAVAQATSSDDVCAVSDPNCELPDPEVKLRRYGQFFGLNYQLPGWLRDVPRVRVRKAEEVVSLRQQEELLELTVLNEKLAGNDSWEIRKSLEYLRQDRETWERIYEYVTKQDAVATLELIEEACQKVEQELSDESREKQSVTQLQNQLKQLQEEVNEAQQRLSMTQARVDQNMRRVNELKAQAVALERVRNTAAAAAAATGTAVEIPLPPAARRKDKNLRSSLDAEEALRNFWFPAEFSSKLTKDLMVPLTLFNEPWVLFRDERGIAACIKDECAHRACPLSLGKVEEGRVVCPYHGWEYDGDGACTKMPSTVQCKGVGVSALPTVEKDGFIWIWPGDGTPPEIPNTLAVPEGFKVHAEIMLEVPVEHGLLVENLLDLAHAPFTHTETFAKGWPIPDVVRFHADQLLFGHWDPYPINMGFQPPCMTISMIGLAQPGKIMRGVTAEQCKNHLHQLHVCMPSRKGHTRLLYRMCMDFMPWISYVPFIDRVWKNVAGQVLGEDLKLVLGQQRRLEAGSDTWANPVAYDKLAVRYRRWRNQAAAGELPPGTSNNLVTMSAGTMFAVDEGYTDDDPEGMSRLQQQQVEEACRKVDPSQN